MPTIFRSDGRLDSWGDIIPAAAAYLRRHNVPDAQTAAELLAARLLCCGRGFLAPRLGESISVRHKDAMRRGMVRLAGGEPLQHVIGEWDFRSLTLKCDRRALIPRPETEELVERVLRFAKAGVPSAAGRPPFFVDIGTGSGCIILSLAKEARDGIFLGTDVSPDAIALAKENAVLCGLENKARFAVADGLDEFDPESVDVIVSNPPYVASGEIAGLDPRVRDFEPRSALDGGEKGLDFYERLIPDAFIVLKPGGAIFLEIGDGQGAAVGDILRSCGFGSISVEKDYSGHDRYASAVLPADC